MQNDYGTLLVCVCIWMLVTISGHIVHFYAQTKVPTCRVLVRYCLSFSLAYLPRKNFIKKLWHHLLDTTAFGLLQPPLASCFNDRVNVRQQAIYSSLLVDSVSVLH